MTPARSFSSLNKEKKKHVHESDRNANRQKGDCNLTPEA